jgi:hypothetical protein
LTGSWSARLPRLAPIPCEWGTGTCVGGVVSETGCRAIHRAKKHRIVPGCSRSQMACRPSGSLAAAKPLDSSVNEMPALTA